MPVKEIMKNNLNAYIDIKKISGGAFVRISVTSYPSNRKRFM